MKWINVKELEPKIWLITLNRPEALNALNSAVLSELQEVLQGFATGGSAKASVLILTGAGEKSFVAGADIREMQSLKPEEATQFSLKGQKLFQLFNQLPMPVIAAVNGFALGGGLELALACDFIYASENAKLGLPEVGLGLIPGFGGTVRLTQRIGIATSMEMILTGDAVDASTAARLGLVNKVCAPAELIAECLKTARKIQSRGPLAVANAKRSVQTQKFEAEAYALEAKLFGDLFSAKDTREGMTAFIEKRKPQFLGN